MSPLYKFKDVTYYVNLQLFADNGHSEHTTNHFLTLFRSNSLLFSNTLSNIQHFFITTYNCRTLFRTSRTCSFSNTFKFTAFFFEPSFEFTAHDLISNSLSPKVSKPSHSVISFLVAETYMRTNSINMYFMRINYIFTIQYIFNFQFMLF